MTKREAYLHAGKEAVAAARDLEGGPTYPQAAFYAIHAFEMAGRAYLIDADRTPGNTHKRRMRQFGHVAEQHGMGTGLMQLAARCIHYRERCLYPKERGDGTWSAPRQAIDAQTASSLVARVGGVVQLIERRR